MIAPTPASQGRSRSHAQITKAAKAAASSPHGLINLTRLVQALDNRLRDTGEDGYEGSNGMTSTQDLESLEYSRLLLDAIQAKSEGSSQDVRTLANLDTTLRLLEERSAPVIPPKINGTVREDGTLLTAPTSRSLSNGEQDHDANLEAPIPGITAATPIRVSVTSSVTRRRKIDTGDYLARRAREDAEGNDSGLLPLRVVQQKKEDSTRDQLLAGGGSITGMGARQLHEEMGGQLADMSYRLKLNALHFASSLNDEKDMLENSQLTLEKNLDSTKTSKKNLAVVSKKGRGTTCMTLGIVVLVLVLFVWTYMLIRFT